MEEVNRRGVPTKTFIREAIMEKLIRDGYMQKSEE